MWMMSDWKELKCNTQQEIFYMERELGLSNPRRGASHRDTRLLISRSLRILGSGSGSRRGFAMVVNLNVEKLS